jgi:hypothetical protein
VKQQVSSQVNSAKLSATCKLQQNFHSLTSRSIAGGDSLVASKPSDNASLRLDLHDLSCHHIGNGAAGRIIRRRGALPPD